MRIVILSAFALLLVACRTAGKVLPSQEVGQTPLATAIQAASPTTASAPLLLTSTPSPFPPTATPAVTATITPTVTSNPLTAEIVNIMYLENGQLMIVIDLKAPASGDFEAHLDGNPFVHCPRHPNDYWRLTCIGTPPDGISTAQLTVFDHSGGPEPFLVEEITISNSPE